MKNFPLFKILLLLVIGIAVVFTYWDLPKTFYQQDEWLGSGKVLALGFNTVIHGLSPFQIIFGDSRPLTGLLGVIFFKSFGFASLPYALYGISFHLCNTFVVFLISRKILKKDLSAAISAAYFGLSSVSHQSITWFAASFGVQPASLCIFLSIYLFLIYVENKRKIFISFSLFFALLSLYFKESGIFLFVFLPLLPFIFEKKVDVKKYIKLFMPLMIFISLFVLYRLIEMTILRQLAGATISSSSVYAGLGQGKISFLQTLILRSIMYPSTSFSLIFVPVYTALAIASQFMHLYYPFITSRVDLISETIVLDFLAIAVSLLLLWYMCAKLLKNMYSKQVIYFALSFFFLSIVPYIIVGKTFAYMEPRYYYIPLAASGIILGYIAQNLFLMRNITGSIIKVLFFCFFLWLIIVHINETRQDIQRQVDIANERKGFIKQLLNELPTLKASTNVFYFASDKSWLVDNNTVPFQHGFGYSIPVLYYSSGKMPKGILISGYLWELGSEGYKKQDNLAYGYYTVLDHLKKGVLQYKFSPEDIHAFSYDSQTRKLKDITGEIRYEVQYNSD